MKKSFLQLPEDMTSQERNAFLSGVLLAVPQFAAAIYYLYLGRISGSVQFYAMTAISVVVGMLCLIGVVLIRRRRSIAGTVLILSSLAILYPTASLLSKGVGLVVGIALAIVGPMIAFQVLPRKLSRVMAVATVISGLATILLDILGSATRPSLPGFVVQILATLVILTLGYLIFRQAWRGNLRTKLLTAFIGVTVVATGALGTFMFITTSNNLRDNLERELTAQTVDRATRIGDLYNEQLSTLTTLSLDEVLLQAVETQNNSYEGSAADIQTRLDARDAQWRAADAADNNNDPLVRQNLSNAVAREVTKYQQAFPDNIEVFVTDVYGGLAGSTDRTSDYYQADEEWWQVAYNDGQGGVYIGVPEFDESANAVGSQIALPFRDSNSGEIIGILRTTFLVTPLTTILGEKIGQTDETDLIIPGEVISRINYTGDYESIETEEFEALRAVADQGMVEMDYEGELSVVTQTRVRTLEGNSVVDDLGWVVVLSQHRDEAFAPVNSQVRGIVIVLAIALALVAAAAYFLSLLLVRPIIQLTATAEEISAGNLDSRAEVTTTDEVGTLATTFNSMTSRLQETLQGLEQRVAERTQNLELAAEVGRSVSQVRELDVMLKDACELIRKEFDLYYVQVYLTNPSQTELSLQAGTGEVGVQLLERKHRLQFNTGSINGRAAVEKRSVVITNTAQSDTFQPNPLLPDTRGEMAVPLIVADKVVGVLDMQSSHPDTLTEEVLPAFEALAGQLAVAIQNANLVAEAEQARAEVEAQARRLVRTGWDEYLDAIHKPEQIGFAFDHDKVVPLAEIDEPSDESQTVSASISLTGEELGSLVVEIDEENKKEQISELVSIVARQVAQQIENLRLLESAERFRFEAEQAARRQTRENWREYIGTKTGESLGYLYDLNEVRPYNNGHDAETDSLNLPLKVRDETVGKLAVQGLTPDDKDTLELVNAIAERLGAHIEGLRLTRQIQSRAQREQALRQITNAVRGSTNLTTIMRTAVRELGSVMGRRAVIRLATLDQDTEEVIGDGNIDQQPG